MGAGRWFLVRAGANRELAHRKASRFVSLVKCSLRIRGSLVTVEQDLVKNFLIDIVHVASKVYKMFQS